MLKFIQQFCVSLSEGKLFPSLYETSPPWAYPHLKPTTARSYFWIKPHLFCNVSLCSNFMWNNVFPIFDQCRFFLHSVIGAGDIFLVLSCRYVPAVAIVQYFMNNAAVLEY